VASSLNLRTGDKQMIQFKIRNIDLEEEIEPLLTALGLLGAGALLFTLFE
jgi:hypothetical protein